jgi:hypothetical protein
MNTDHCLMVCSVGLVATILVLITVVANHRRHHQTLTMLQATPVMMHAALLQHDAIKQKLNPSGAMPGVQRLPYGTSSDGEVEDLHGASAMPGVQRLPYGTSSDGEVEDLDRSSAVLQRARAAAKEVNVKDLV